MSRSSVARLALLALLWGSGFLWIKLALRGFSPVQIVLIRLALGALVLAPIALARGMRIPTGLVTWVHLFVAALVANAIPYTLFGIGERTVDSNVAGVINATTPLWTVLVAFLAGADRKVTPRRGAGLALGFAGTLLIFTPWESASEIASWGGLAILAPPRATASPTSTWQIPYQSRNPAHHAVRLTARGRHGAHGGGAAFRRAHRP